MDRVRSLTAALRWRAGTADVDGAEDRAGMSIKDAKLSDEGDSLHVTTGPAANYWMDGANASGNYTVKATFHEPKYMNLNSASAPLRCIHRRQ